MLKFEQILLVFIGVIGLGLSPMALNKLKSVTQGIAIESIKTGYIGVSGFHKKLERTKKDKFQ